MFRARHLVTSELLAMAKNTYCPQVLRARHLLTSVLLAMAPKVWMHKPGIPGLLVVRIVEKLSQLSKPAFQDFPSSGSVVRVPMPRVPKPQIS